VAITGLNLPRAGEKYSAPKPSASFDGLAERMTEFRKKKKKEEDDAAAAAQSAANKKQADDKAAADKAAQDKKNSLPHKIASGIADIFQANSAADQQRRVQSGQPALYADQQAQKKQTADAFKGQTADEFGRADNGLNLSPDELNKRRDHYKAAGIDVDQLQKDKAAYDAVQQRLNNGEKLYKLTLDNQIPEGAKRYEKSKKDVAKAEASYQRNQQAAAGAETAGGQAERGFVRGMGAPLIEVPSNLETLAGSAIKAVAPAGSRVQQAGEKVYEHGKTDRQALQSDIQHAGYAPTAADNPTISAFSEGAGSLAASLTAAKYLKATAAPAAMFGINQGADQAVASEKAGKSDVQSAVTGITGGAIEGLLEKVGLDKFLGAEGKSVIKSVTTRMLTEGTQEATQSLAQSGATATYSHVDLQQAIQQSLTEGGLGAILGGGAGLPMSIAEHLQAKGVDQNTALQTGFNVQDRLESIITEEKAKQPKAAPENQPTAPQDVQAGKPEPSSAAPNENDQIKLRYPKVEDLPDAIKQQLAGKDSSHNGFSYDTEQRLKAGKVSQGDLERAGLAPLLSKADVKTLVSAVPQLKQNPILKVEADQNHNTILTYSDENHDIKLKPGAFGLTHERLAAAGVSVGTEIDLSEALKPEKGSGPVATVQRGGKDYLAMPEDQAGSAADRSAGPQDSQPAAPEATTSSPATKNLFASQTDTESQSPNKKIDNEHVALLNQQQQVITNKLIAAKRSGNTDAVATAIDELESVSKQMERATVAGNDIQNNPSPATGTANSDGVRPADAKPEVRQADKPAANIQPGPAGDRTTTAAPKPAVASSAAVRAPAAEGASGTIKSDELHAGNQSSNEGDQSGRGSGSGEQSSAAGSTGKAGADVTGGRPDSKDAEVATDKRSSPGAQKQSEGRQQALKAIEDHKALSEGRVSERPAAEMAKLVEQLNKAAQAGAILRRGDLKSKKAAGMFVRKGGDGKDPKTAKDPRIMLQDAVIKDPQQYATVLAHELSHAMEFYINGNTNKTLSMFDLSKDEEIEVTNELKKVVDELETPAVAQARPEYFYKPTEMLARYVEMRLLFPGKAEIMAPKLTEAYEQLVMREPMVQDLMAALDNNIDKGAVNFTPSFLKDIRQIYRKHLGKHVGDLAYDAEVQRRAELQRSDGLIRKLVKQKFKGVKDAPDALFHAAEAILVTKDGQPQFGTHDFLWDVQQRDLEGALKGGYEVVEKKPALTDKQMKAILAGEEVPDSAIKYEYDLSKVRYTPAQAEKIFNDLSDKGQQLIKDFTAAKEDAKDEFNRDLMKGLYHIDSKVEGWVHHYFEGKPMAGNKKASLRHKIAAAKKQRLGAEGYVEDFRKATEKALLELDRNEINNSFIRDQLARISKPIAKGEKPENGWVEVVADEKGGLRLPGEGMQVIIKPDEGKAVRVPQKRYQVPRELAEHYREIRDLPREANIVARAFNQLAKYWTLNVLVHPGTASTNFISGGLQYGAKIMNDFYLDALTANFSMSRTRHNLIAPLQVLTPRGWTNAPDWLYGGYRSGTQGGQSADRTGDSRIDRGIDQYGDKMLKAFGLVETYWKKTIALSEGSKLAGASNRRITDRLQADELKMVAALNEAIDFYAFDYDNKPLWMSKFDRKGGKFIKPFMTYPYKYTKFLTDFAAGGFDRSLPWQQRAAKVMTITTIVALIATLYRDREKDKKTPVGSEKTPLSLNPGGRLFVGTTQDAKEMFLRTAKYPFFNLTSLGEAAVKRNGAEVSSILNEMFATVGPGFDLFMLATGRADQFDQYTPVSERVGEMVGSFIPGFRVLSDTGKLLDEKSRQPNNFIQGVGSQLPIWGSEATRAKWRGGVRTIKIPDETPAGRPLTRTSRTITEREVTLDKADILRSLLTGIYVRRIDPEEAKKWVLREQRDIAEKQIRDLLAAGNNADADTLAQEYGFTISNDTYKYYQAKKKKDGQGN
jgi:hypothetical protein